MTSKFSRFLHLERSRADRPKPQEPSQLQSGNRFETLAQRGDAPQGSVVPEAHLERFRGVAPLSLEEGQKEDELYFPRCGSCESDNGRFAKECSVCGADLNTPQQRAYNERLREARRQELAREREVGVPLSQQKHEEERRADQARYSQMLEKLRQEERSSVRWHVLFDEGSFGLKLLGLIPNPAVRLGILFLSILIPVALWRYGRGQVSSAGLIMGGVVLILLLPGRSSVRRWWR